MTAKGLTTGEVQAHLAEVYGTDMSREQVSKITDAILGEMAEWMTRPLERVYPVVFIDAMVVKIRDGQVANRPIYTAIGVTVDGKRDVLGLWAGTGGEGAKFWLQVVTELRNRGVQDIFIACVDGLKGFPEAIEAVYPRAAVQLCVVHMVRHSLNYVSWKMRKAVAADLRRIYTSATADEAEQRLGEFEDKWDDAYLPISQSWRRNWSRITPFFDYPPEIRKVIYTTNAIESLNSVIRSATKRRKLFPSDESALKVVYLAISQAAKKWTMPIQNWRLALNRFMIEFGERIEKYAH